MEYPHKTLLLNGKRISIKKIVNHQEEGNTQFEKNTLAFIREWLSNKNIFQLKTSGSTGAPKKIKVSRRQMIASATLTLKTLGVRRGGKTLLCIDPQYIGGIMMLVRSFVNDMRIVAIEPSSIKNYDQIPSKIELVAFVPLQVQTLAENKTGVKNLNRFRNIIIGGGALNEKIARKINKSGTTIYSTYGMTETLSHVALKQISPVLEDFFKALPAIKIGVDERACLTIKTPFLKRTMHTNDLVQLESETTFKWLGRYDTIINSGGIKIIPEVIEKRIHRVMEKIKNQFYISSTPDKKLGNCLVLVLEGEKMLASDEKKLLAEIKNELPKYHAPKKILYIKSFKIVNNKIIRS